MPILIILFKYSHLDLAPPLKYQAAFWIFTAVCIWYYKIWTRCLIQSPELLPSVTISYLKQGADLMNTITSHVTCLLVILVRPTFDNTRKTQICFSITTNNIFMMSSKWSLNLEQGGVSEYKDRLSLMHLFLVDVKNCTLHYTTWRTSKPPSTLRWNFFLSDGFLLNSCFLSTHHHHSGKEKEL